MPVYVYKNLTTGATFEVEQRMTAAALTADPATGEPVKRVVQPVGIAFKGSGFYVTDSRGKSAAAKPSQKTDAPQVDATKGDATNGDASRADAPKADAPPPPVVATSSSVAASGTD